MPFRPPRSSLATASAGPAFTDELLASGALRPPAPASPMQKRAANRRAVLAAIFSGDEACSVEEVHRLRAQGELATAVLLEKR